MPRTIDWGAVLTRLREHPGRWIRVFPDAPSTRARNVNERRAPELHLQDERVVARVLHEYEDTHGTKRGDIWLRIEKRGPLAVAEGPTEDPRGTSHAE